MFLLLTWPYFRPSSSVSVVDFEQVNVSWVAFELPEVCATLILKDLKYEGDRQKIISPCFCQCWVAYDDL